MLWGRSPHLEETRGGFREEKRAYEGRGCFERSTLNEERKANRKRAALFNSFPHDASSKSQLRDSKCEPQCNRENDNETSSTDIYRSTHLLAFAMVLRT